METKLIKYIIHILFSLAVFVSGCEKSEIPYYNSTHDAVRFPISSLSSTETSGYDSSTGLFHTGYSFIEDPFAEYTIYNVPLILVGNRVDHDRKINYFIDFERSSAPTGSYEILESLIPAGSYTGHIRMKLYNAEELNEEVRELYIALKESDELSLAAEKYTSAVMSWNNMIPAPTLTAQIRTYNNLIVSPAGYNSSSIEYYSPNALKAIVDALNWNDWDNYDIHGVAYNSDGYKYLPKSTSLPSNSYKSYAVKLGIYIKAYNEIHPDTPLLHNAGGLKGQLVEAKNYAN